MALYSEDEITYCNEYKLSDKQVPANTAWSGSLTKWGCFEQSFWGQLFLIFIVSIMLISPWIKFVNISKNKVLLFDSKPTVRVLTDNRKVTMKIFSLQGCLILLFKHCFFHFILFKMWNVNYQNLYKSGTLAYTFDLPFSSVSQFTISTNEIELCLLESDHSYSTQNTLGQSFRPAHKLTCII